MYRDLSESLFLLLYARGIPEVMVPIFFTHSGNTDEMKFYAYIQDSDTLLYKKFRVNSYFYSRIWNPVGVR